MQRFTYDQFRRYEAARQHEGPAALRCYRFLGLTKFTLDVLEAEYQKHTHYVSCKWCGIQTSRLKKDAHHLGTYCSEDCRREGREHYV